MSLVLLLDNNKHVSTIVKRLDQLLALFKEQPVQFYYIVSDQISNVFQVSTVPAVVLAKTKRSRYVAMEGGITVQNVQAFLEEVFSGNGKFKPMKDTMQALF